MAAADSLLTPLSSCTAHGRSSWQQVDRPRHASSAHGGQHGHVAGLQPSGEGTAEARRRSRALPKVVPREGSLAALPLAIKRYMERRLGAVC